MAKSYTVIRAPRTPFPLSPAEIRRLCTCAQVCDATVRRWWKGKPVRPLLAASIANAVEMLGMGDKLVRKAG